MYINDISFFCWKDTCLYIFAYFNMNLSSTLQEFPEVLTRIYYNCVKAYFVSFT